MWTDDPVADYSRYDAKCQKEIEQLPTCSECDEHITDDFAYYIDGEWICEDCMKEYRRSVEPEY